MQSTLTFNIVVSCVPLFCLTSFASKQPFKNSIALCRNIAIQIKITYLNTQLAWCDNNYIHFKGKTSEKRLSPLWQAAGGMT